MNIKYFFLRFESRRKIHVGKVNPIAHVLLYIDYFTSFILHGASINDYFAYKFYQLRYNGRREYVTYRRYHKIQNICNPSKTEIEICRDKIKFNTYFKTYLGRKWLDVSSSTFDEFNQFMQNIGDTVFIKAIDSYRGIGVESCVVKDLDISELYKKLRNDNASRYILEEKIQQYGEIADFHKWSINTIRIITVYDTLHDKVHIISANLRVGRSKDHRDNLHSGGIAVQIDIETGIMFSPGFDQDNNLYIVHPDSNKQFIGFKIPYWKECKNFITEVAKKLPTVRYVGWDIVSKGDGSFILIEGNDNADHDIQQLNNKGMWKLYKNILKDIKHE